MQHGNGDVKLGDHRILLREEACVDFIEVVVAVLGAHEDLLGFGDETVEIAVILELQQIGTSIPSALLGDVDGYDVVFVGVEGVDGLQR